MEKGKCLLYGSLSRRSRTCFCQAFLARDKFADSLAETARRLLRCFDGRPQEEKQAFVDEANEHGNTALHWAALGGHLDAVKLLMEHAASPALANESNYVPLDLANLNDKRQVAEHFLASAGMLENDNGEAGGLASAAESIELTGQDEDDTGQDEDDTGSKAA